MVKVYPFHIQSQTHACAVHAFFYTRSKETKESMQVPAEDAMISILYKIYIVLHVGILKHIQHW